MNCLKKLSQTLCNIFQKNRSEEPLKINPEPFPNVVSEELIARFLFSSSHFSKQKVKYAAFIPASDGDASVFRISQLEENEIQFIENNIVAKARGKASKRRAEFIADQAFSQLKLRSI